MKQLSEITRNVVLFCLLVAAMACPVTLSAQTQGTGNRVFHVNQIPLKLVFVKGGDMQMGCSDERDGDCMSQEAPTHTVTLTDFYIGETEITQAQWMAVMGRDNNPSYWKGNTLPVERVSWEECHRFIARLNKYLSAELPEGYRFALPSEAQWEYAARGGLKSARTRYAGGNAIAGSRQEAGRISSRQRIDQFGTYRLQRLLRRVAKKVRNDLHRLIDEESVL